MKLIICLNILDFLECFRFKPNYTEQINSLLSNSFPTFFPADSYRKVTIFSQLENLVKYGKIKKEDVVTFVKISNNIVISFAQLVHEKNP